jgi:hypothetical protein
MIKTVKKKFYYPNLSYTASGNKFETNKSTVQSSIIAASSKYSNTMNAAAEVIINLQNRLRAFVERN